LLLAVLISLLLNGCVEKQTNEKQHTIEPMKPGAQVIEHKAVTELDYGPYAGHGTWGGDVKSIYDKLSNKESDNYDFYLSSISKSTAQNIASAEGIKLPAVTFKALQNAQDSHGKANYEWTVTGER
ncbi:hypothetical protein ACFQ5D_23925, partial [Paenibacillus farraposensis]